jgi:alkanesulfonate monooxygenase SsuD/methylene tetrahydromethanopterin reductase-like flavin-dependent oxidoreductase (luciferase family)
VKVPGADVRISVASPGFVGDDAQAAKDLWWTHYHEAFRALGEIRGFPAPQRAAYDREANGAGALFVGSPDEIADRILALHGAMGHDRHFFQMDLGQLPQKEFLKSIELLGTKVKPLVDAALAGKAGTPGATE